MVRALATKGASSFVVLGGDGCVLVDTGMDRGIRTLERGLNCLGVGLGRITLVVVTHAHVDHCGALAALRTVCKIPVAAQRFEAPFLERGEPSPTVPRNGVGRAVNYLCRKMRNQPCPVDIIVDEDLDLRPYGVDARVIRTPGHTPGSLSVVTGDGQAVVGDLFRGKPGRRGLGLFCAAEADSRRSLERIAALSPARIFPAHGPEADAEELYRFMKSLKAL